MKTTTSFTSTISPQLIKWVDNRARTERQTRRAVLEDAIRSYQRESMKNVLKSGFERAAHDTDMLKLAELGIGDYTKLIETA